MSYKLDTVTRDGNFIHTIEDDYGQFIFEFNKDSVYKLSAWSATPSKVDQWDKVAQEFDDIDALWNDVVLKRHNVTMYFTIEQVKAFYVFVSQL